MFFYLNGKQVDCRGGFGNGGVFFTEADFIQSLLESVTRRITNSKYMPGSLPN